MPAKRHHTTHSDIDELHDLGLAHDFKTLLQRRRAIAWLAGSVGAAALPILGCGGNASDDTGTTVASTSGSSGSNGSSSGSTSTCSVIPEETAGPYPGDGSNGANALMLSGIVRSDIRSSIAGAAAVAGGVPLTVTLQLVNTRSACADLAGYAIYLWHCDREGRYSMYSSGVTGENYLRGVQETASDGTATFTTIFPGCYAGRMPHIHFEVYISTSTALSYTNKLKTSQLAFPLDVCTAAYATTGYSASVTNLARISFATDMVFSDGVTTQLATMTGNVTDGYTAALTVGISV